ncbi:MAG: peptidase M14, partial [Bacteroidales bacterium]|nr:peptidase M14 [Bacteroidales bacterium]
MKKATSLILFLLLSIVNFAQKVDLNYYLPENISLNLEIPTPEDFLGFQVGEWHVSHDQLTAYMRLLAAKSDRAVIQEYGRSYENKTLLHLIFTSPDNQSKLNELKKAHQDLCDPTKSSNTDISSMPVVILLGYSVHGNEASGANASLLSAYYLAAAEGDEIEKVLENSIILIDPCLNPDGLTRFTTWANMYKSQQISADPNNLAFSEAWPGGRTNHYWFDLNRDYLLLTNPESKGRVQKLQEWRPNVVTDHHEMGSNSSFFFQPGVKSRNNPLTPDKNYTLTKKIASYHSDALNKIGSLYFSEEIFDDYYFGKGSSYPDINGGIGILFEQASVRGFERETVNGKLTFPFAIRNQFRVSLSTI